MGDPEIKGGGGAEGSSTFHNILVSERCLTTTELSTHIKEDTVLTWQELPIPVGKPNYRSPVVVTFKPMGGPWWPLAWR